MKTLEISEALLDTIWQVPVIAIAVLASAAPAPTTPPSAEAPISVATVPAVVDTVTVAPVVPAVAIKIPVITPAKPLVDPKTATGVVPVKEIAVIETPLLCKASNPKAVVFPKNVGFNPFDCDIFLK